MKRPLLCLKIGVPRALFNGECVTLDTPPVKHEGKTMIPKSALDLVGVECKSDYLELGEIDGINGIENETGLILFDEDENILHPDSKKDKVYLLSLANSFIFEIPFGKLGNDYAPATDEERAGFIEVGAKVRGLLLKRNNTHPFLFGSQEIFDKLRSIYNSDGESEVKKHIIKLLERADKHLSRLPALNAEEDGLDGEMPGSGYGEDEYDVGGRHSSSESALEEISHVAFAYQMTLDERYAKLAYYLSLGIIERKHWGPGHFLNCSGATGRLSMIYDWLYGAWKGLDLDTGLIKRGIYTHGLLQGYNSVINDACDFPSPKQGSGWRFKLKPDNWNSVCNSGMIIGSLCLLNDGTDDVITDEIYERITELLGACITSTMQPDLVLTQYVPDGSYVESNSYWAYGTVNLMNSMAALYDSLGTDLGLHHACGLDKTCYYAIYTESPEFVGWNYHDGGLGMQNTSSFNQFATISGDGLLYALRRDHLLRGKDVALFDMMYHPEVRGKTVPALESLPLDYAMTGIDAFAVRSGWENGSLYAGIIGGENPSGGSHNQLDSGAFIYHNLGKLWFTDLGSDYYNSKGKNNGLGYFSNYSLYRRNAEGNNALALKSLPYGQLLGGRGAMTEHSSSDSASYCIIDDLSVYGKDKVSSARRGMLLTNDRRTLIIKDEVSFVGKETAYFTAHFESDKISAEISEDGKKCALTHKDGEKLYVSVLGDGRLELMNCSDPLLDGTYPAEGELSRDNYSRLVIKHENAKKINSAFVIDTEISSYENINMEMWKTL